MKLVSRSHLWLITVLLITDTVLFTATDPQEVSSIVLIVGFLLFAITAYFLVLAALTALSWYGVLQSDGQRRRTARIVTGLLAGLVALQSIGQLSPRDVLVLLPLTILAYLYVTYGRADKRGSSSVAAN